MRTYANIKSQVFVMPDGSTHTIENTKNYVFAVVCNDPNSRFLCFAITGKQVQDRLAYYKRIMPNDDIRIIKRASYEFIYRDDTGSS